MTLNRNHPNISILKGEGFSVDIACVIEGTNGAMRVFGGHGGIEFLSLLRSGGVGLIPAPDFLKPQVAIFELWQQGTPDSIAEAERLHRELLLAIVFMSRSGSATLCSSSATSTSTMATTQASSANQADFFNALLEPPGWH